MFMKFIFGIAWIGIFILAVLGIYIGMFPAYLEILDFNSLITRGAVAGISLVYLLLFVEKLINLFERPKELRMKTPNGMLKISSNSVNNIVKEVVGEHPKVRNLKVKNKTNGKKLKIFVSIDIMSSQSLSDDLNLIQQDIKDRIESYLDLSITEIELRVTKLIKDKSNNGRGD
ncbi:alkaline shock response membrane anchor protein AmaP [Fusobacteria bacterium ZRK30]|nr:alkaline shock response membrane anchor protein AmaP [Fusobacteria bacterium ZRK30]